MTARKTKIFATIGPSSKHKETLEKMVNEGLDVIRINSAYGNEAQYEEILSNLEAADKKGKVKKVFDIKGTDKLDFCKKHRFEFIAISFTETKEQILEVKNKFPDVFIISKIESVKGVRNYPEILEASDGIMVARGDLSTAVTLEKVPPLQKKFTKMALENNRFVVAATEMLMSMVKDKTPTNAEVSDVANAVFDGAHAVMLSEETAIGDYPVESVAYMRKIVEEAEKWCDTNECRI